MSKILLKLQSVIAVLPDRLQPMIENLEVSLKDSLQEIRLRAEKPVVLICDGTAYCLSITGRATQVDMNNLLIITKSEIRQSFNRVCGYSVHSCTQQINNGFITIDGGHRVGVCGTAFAENENIEGVRDVAMLNIRVARQVKGCADELCSTLFSSRLRSVIIAGPPSSGKTTMLRDIAANLSGSFKYKNAKVSIIDQRSEIAAMKDGVANNDIGINCDVFNAYPKNIGINIALRCFSPDVIICDEVGTLEEVEAIASGVNTGVQFIVSAHCEQAQDLFKRKITRALLGLDCFEKAVMLSSHTPCKVKNIFDICEFENENSEFFTAGNISGMYGNEIYKKHEYAR